MSETSKKDLRRYIFPIIRRPVIERVFRWRPIDYDSTGRKVFFSPESVDMKTHKTSDLALDIVAEWLDIELRSILRNSQGDPYVKVWCDIEKREGLTSLDTYYIIRTTDSDVDSFLSKLLPLKKLVENSPADFFEIRKYEGCKLLQVETSEKALFPLMWMPAEDSYHDPTLRLET